ncbi:EamA family transporter [Kiritimatiellota bacterium B12222]|nr:EamA family transporter [Kiritimatiellota bacterium B12222]
MFWLLAACLLWGPSFGLTPILMGEKAGQYGMDPYLLSVLRMLFSFILFAPLMSGQKISLRRKGQLAMLGGLQFGLMYLALFVSYRFMTGYEVALVTIFTPIYVSLLDNYLTKNTFKLQPVLCVLLAVIGAGIIRYAKPDLDGEFWIGFGIMQLCNLSFALGQVLYRRMMKSSEKLDDMHAFGWMYLGALLVTLIGWGALAPIKDSLQNLQQLPLSAWGIILWLGLIPSGLAFFMFNHGALQVDGATLAIINNVKIPVALIIVLLFFRQSDVIDSWGRFSIGTLFMLGALWLNQRPLSRLWIR